MGLREKQKADRNRRILEAAALLFRTVGYDSARIEDIAESAEISVGTFYNYYENKGDILLAIVSMEVEEVLEAGNAVLKSAPASVADALQVLIGQYFDHSLVYLNKEMWRTAMALAIQRPETPFSKRYTELDRRLCQQVASLVKTLQRNGVVKLGIDSIAIGEMIFNNFNMMFIEFAKSEVMTVEELKLTVLRQNRPIATLMGT